MAAALPLLASCGGGHADAHAGEEAAEESAGHGGEIVISGEEARRAGIAVETVRPGEFHGVVAVGGKILEAQGDERTIVSPADGVVTLSASVAEGARVGAGRTLATVSASRVQGGSAWQRAKVAYEAARRDYERAKKLVADKIVAEKEFNAIESAYADARLAFESVDADASGAAAVSSPIGGYVKAALVKDGDYVTAGQPLLSVTQNRRLYLRADVPVRYYGSLAAVSSATFRPSYADSTFALGECGGRLVAVGRGTGATPGYIPVTFEFDNGPAFVSGAYADVWLATARRSGVLTLPVGALTEEQGAFFVYVQADSTCYVKREVRLGETDGRRVEVKSGLKAGERVVTRGAIRVRLASAANVIPAHTHNH